MIAILLFIGTAVFHLSGLTNFPIFADEAIYIHWAQSALRDSQYLFLPMLDGKPPLHTWLLMPFVSGHDPLFAARTVSVVVGLLSVLGMGYIFREISPLASKKTQHLVLLFSSILPFWFFHAHLALAEQLLVLGYILAFLGTLFLSRKNQLGFLFVVVGVGVALWTKTSAFFLLPTLLGPMIYHHPRSKKIWFRFITAMGLGVGVFLLLRIHPLFGTLFSRSADYSFTFSQLIQGEWRYVLQQSFPELGRWFMQYFTLPFAFLALCVPRKFRWLWVMAGVFCLPILLLGRVVSPRYFFPAVVPLTLAGGLAIEYLWKSKQQSVRLAATACVALSLLMSVVFDVQLVFRPNQTPFVPIDRRQYLEDWSSGHGIFEASQYFKQRARDHEIVVATEGYFGSLPDGLSAYFFRQPESPRVQIVGIGQPIRELPITLFVEQQKGKEVYILANEHRLLLGTMEQLSLVEAYPRPGKGPRLLLLRLRDAKYGQ